MATGNSNYRLARIWNAKKLIGQQTISGHVSTAYSDNSVAFSPDGTVLAVAGQGKVQLVDLKVRTKPRMLNLSSYNDVQVMTVAFNPNGQKLAIGCSGGICRELSTITGKTLTTMNGSTTGDSTNHVIYSPDGRFIVSFGNGGVVRIWDNNTGQLRPLKSPAVAAHAFRPDSEILATVHFDGTISLWKFLEKRDELVGTIQLTQPGNESASTSHAMGSDLAFTPDGRHLVTANGHGTVYVLRLKEWSAK